MQEKKIVCIYTCSDQLVEDISFFYFFQSEFRLRFGKLIPWQAQQHFSHFIRSSTFRTNT